MERTAMIQIFN